jgi:hypothetical protein
MTTRNRQELGISGAIAQHIASRIIDDPRYLFLIIPPRLSRLSVIGDTIRQKNAICSRNAKHCPLTSVPALPAQAGYSEIAQHIFSLPTRRAG